MRKIFFLILLLSTIYSSAQHKKSVEILEISTPLIIDGKLDEKVYQLVKPAKDFFQLQPYNGKPSLQNTEAYFFYDKTSIYVGVMLYDNAPDSIYNFLSERDEIGMADYFGVYFDPYNQGQLAYGFFITPAGVQVDIKAIKSDGDSEDGNWNAVWESKTSITDKGWIVEMKIPFSELRFSEKPIQTWGLNMFRNIRRYNSNNSWNFVDRNVSGFIHQEGEMIGLKDIKSPIRLSLTPYLATYLETQKGGSPEFLYKGGLDLRYGINESFTLDMMLIPDFGQIQSDDKQLNLSPYELYYSEKRQFFNEGAELFNRADIFYSRRIGAAPKFSASNSLGSDEIVESNPSETQLINATKISGRTKNGLGVGVLNAMSLTSYANITNSLTGNTRKQIVQPFTNYNVAVVDKSLKNSSYISIINTNVSMFGNPFKANVIATEFQLQNNSKTYSINGEGAFSSRGDSIYETGFTSNFELEKTSGSFQFGLSQEIISDTYNPNDLGYLHRNNQVSTESWITYNIIEPFSIFREIQSYMWWDYKRMYNPSTFFDNNVGFNTNVTFKNNYQVNLNGFFNSDRYDYFEPRVKGRFYKSPYFYLLNFNLNTDRSKPLNLSFQYGYIKQPIENQHINMFDLGSSLRVGQSFQMNYSASLQNEFNGQGFVTKDNSTNEIIFSKRDVKSIENVISTSFILNNKSSVSLRARHYWSGVKNNSFYQLQQNGSLLSDLTFNQNFDQNYNNFTIDMIFKWNFSPGSELLVAWKNDAFDDNDIVEENYLKNLKDTWSTQSNSLSIKVLYYINYNNIFKKK